MFVGTEEREFLDGLQVGDLVVVARSWREWRVRAVDKVTASRAWVGGTQFDRKTGREWGQADSLYRDDLCPLTADRIETARVEVEQNKDRDARRLLIAAITPALDVAPLAVLEQIRTLLSGGTGTQQGAAVGWVRPSRTGAATHGTAPFPTPNRPLPAG